MEGRAPNRKYNVAPRVGEKEDTARLDMDHHKCGRLTLNVGDGLPERRNPGGG